MSMQARAGLAAVAALAAAAVTGCGGSSGGQVAQLGSTAATGSTSSPAASAQQNGAIAFSRCMRSNGVASFPEPTTGGAIPKVALQRLGVSSSRFQSAQRACRHLLPNGGRPPDQAQLQQVKAQGLRFARCMRTHGVPNMPDPGSSGRIPDPAAAGIDQGSPKFEAANQACGKDRPPYMPSNAAYNAWARTHAGSGS